ncbi:MAG TPA: DUF1109 domain-containing protein [Allosphingosinicella sp.]|jgi:hypothetical protein
MNTDALIEALARATAPVPRRAVERRLGAGVVAGASAALALVIAGLGFRPDLAAAAGGAVFWGKAAYPFSLGLVGLVLSAQLARPDSGRLRHFWLLAAPVGLLLAFAVAEWTGAAPAARAGLLLDPLWTCLPLVLMLAIPLLAGLVWAVREMAPTRPTAAGAAAGLAAGGFAATLYCLYCQQASPTYILTRYTVAIALASAAGALLGRRLLRW